MPTALETLVKILKLERQQGCKNSAVIGGLAAYCQNWSPQAHNQARRPEQHVLVDELTDLMNSYEAIEDRDERMTVVGYMLDRITGRAPIPETYEVRLSIYVTEFENAPPAPPEERQRPERAAPSGDEQRNRPQRETPRKSSQKNAPARPASRDDDEDDGDETGGDHEHQDDFYASGAGYSGQLDIPQEPRLARPPRKPRRVIDPDEAADIMRGLNAPVTTVKGIGPRMAKSLDKLGIQTINDLIFFLPRRYDDYTRLQYISKLLPGQTVTVIGTVRHTEVRIGRGGRKDFSVQLDDGSGILPVTFFGQHFLVRSIRAGQQIVVSGQTSMYLGRIQMTNPEWEKLEAENLHTVGIVPVYPLTEGLTARTLRRLMKDTVEYWAERLPDYVPQSVLDRAELADLGWAIKNLHFPEGQDHLRHARNRYIFDQLLMMQMAILANRREWQSVPGQPLTITDEFLEGFIDTVFPYPLTGAQRRAIEDIRRDVTRDIPMNRLLQGDVGAGKTVVATTAMAMAFANGKQAAIMAPTSILAEQHYRGISRVLDQIPGDRKPVIGLLTGALSNSERESIYRGLADGSIDIIIGTHALIQEGVEFKDLAIAVIDEQHRFGVEQRGTLRGKGTNPHLLVMTATPIPRTLALTLYADLDLSVMDEMPPGRIPIKTRIVYPLEREGIYSFIKKQLDEGRQAFVVHPLVEASESSDAKAAVDEYEHLSGIFRDYRVGLLHGRMRPAEKDEIMAAFSNHEFDVLVTTSVAEVGVDIPNASVMAIEGANRFGLAQLHQFRGRVGRGQHASYCLLIPDKDSPEALERLQALEKTTDGFQLAEIDWRMRGPGDLVGTRQSGRNTLQLMESMSPQLVELAQREARTLYEEDPALELPEHRLLRQRVDMLYHPEMDVS